MTRPTITITAEIRHTTERGIAIFQGDRHEMMDERTGELVERDHFVWLPKAQVTICREMRGKGGERIAEIELPEWLARERGLV